MLEETAKLDAKSPELEAGTEVAGYVVEAKIGQGGMGKVYSARHPRIGKRVAIKVLERLFCNDESAVARFEQEARLVNEIRHPNIVDVFQFGELPDKRSFFVMEHLTGETLSDRIDSAPLTIRETVEILDSVCDALEAAHEHGVVHRDLKSDNVFLATTRSRPTVKLLDFGIAKLAGRNELTSVGKTATGIVVGTPAYMSPEQARSQPVGPRTDVYQLGILAYKMLTRRLPFSAANPFDLIVEQLKTPPPSPKKLAPATPDVLARLVVRMMAKSIDERPSVAEIRNVLASLREARARTSSPGRATAVLVGLMLFLAGAVSFGVFWVLEKNKETGSKSVEAPPPAAEPTPTSEPTPPAPTVEAPADPAPLAVAADPTPSPEPEIEIEIEPAPERESGSFPQQDAIEALERRRRGGRGGSRGRADSGRSARRDSLHTRVALHDRDRRPNGCALE